MGKYKEIYGFIYQGFKPEYYYWECIIMLRKFGFAFISVVLRPLGVDLQAYSGLLILMISLMLQLHLRPYNHGDMNFAETFGLVVFWMSLFLGITITSKNLNPSVGIVFAWGIVLINSLFLLYILHALYKLTKVPRQQERLRRRF